MRVHEDGSVRNIELKESHPTEIKRTLMILAGITMFVTAIVIAGCVVTSAQKEFPLTGTPYIGETVTFFSPIVLLKAHDRRFGTNVYGEAFDDVSWELRTSLKVHAVLTSDARYGKWNDPSLWRFPGAPATYRVADGFCFRGRGFGYMGQMDGGWLILEGDDGQRALVRIRDLEGCVQDTFDGIGGNTVTGDDRPCVVSISTRLPSFDGKSRLDPCH